jgi:hypothetical protein
MNLITYFALLFSSFTSVSSDPMIKTAQDPQPAYGCTTYFDPALKLTVYTSAEKASEYPGGASALGQFINKNLVEANLDPNVDCNVKIKMIIDAAGEIKKAVAIRGDAEVKEPNANEKEVVRVYLKSGTWVPGKCGGNNVATEIVESFTPCIK